MVQTQETDATAFEEGPITPTRIGLAAGVMDVLIFAVVGYIALENVAIGGISGLLVGIGVFLFLPIFMLADEDGELEDLAPENDDTPLREFHRLAGGFAFSAAGIILLATGFAEMEFLVGLPAALVAGSVVYLGAGFVMPNAQLPN
ncbi:hypothetical protein [Natronobacterium texcoconense]|uniref:Uncharacterized protein n=1 Tax=Natronobacterium texcoconense TaxID=1095778 RepID=A0A1H0ZAV0_NATTX|nr:hypothetical protein [Natronobacterium texcoconense]SDQ24509.1 hypothetical protein SAMN04489842_0204 [Natronobacterium texcoconense]